MASASQLPSRGRGISFEKIALVPPFGTTPPFFCRKIVKPMDTNSPSEIFPCSDLDRRERVWYFADYAAGACLPLLELSLIHI